MTTAEMVTLVKSRLGGDTTNAVSDAQILAFLNERMAEICADSNVLVSAWTASTVQSQQQYSVPTEYTSVEAIRIYSATGSQVWLDKVPLTQLDPRKSEGKPRRFALWGLNVSGDNSPAFWLDPIPDANGSSDLECYGRQLPKTMVSGGQGPEVRLRWQYAVVNGALALCYMRIAAGDPNWLPLADRASAMWANDKKEAEAQNFLEQSSPSYAQDTAGYTWGY